MVVQSVFAPEAGEDHFHERTENMAGSERKPGRGLLHQQIVRNSSVRRLFSTSFSLLHRVIEILWLQMNEPVRIRTFVKLSIASARGLT
jgi:hypothetical protein